MFFNLCDAVDGFLVRCSGSGITSVTNQQHVDIEWITVVSSAQLIGWAKVVSRTHLLFLTSSGVHCAVVEWLC